MGFPCGSAGEESTCNVGDLGSIPGLGRSPGEGKCYPLQYSGLENSWGHKESATTERLSLHFTCACMYVWMCLSLCSHMHSHTYVPAHARVCVPFVNRKQEAKWEGPGDEPTLQVGVCRAGREQVGEAGRSDLPASTKHLSTACCSLCKQSAEFLLSALHCAR